jgi:hypothetical protein
VVARWNRWIPSNTVADAAEIFLDLCSFQRARTRILALYTEQLFAGIAIISNGVKTRVRESGIHSGEREIGTGGMLTCVSGGQETLGMIPGVGILWAGCG